jgi:hypothetical protein
VNVEHALSMIRPRVFSAIVLLQAVLLGSASACADPETAARDRPLRLSELSDEATRIAEGLTYPAELVELADSSVIAADRRTAEVSRRWPSGKRQLIGTLGDGPGEFRFVWQVLPVAPDSVLISPSSEYSPFAVISTETGLGRSLQRRDVVEVADPRRDIRVDRHTYTRADTLGYVYGAPTGWSFVPNGGSRYTDSVPLVRLNIRSGRLDTILRFAIGDVPSESPPIVGNEIRQQLGLGPYRAENDWIIKGDGTIILVDARRYQIMERTADGRIIAWPDLPAHPIRAISDSEWSAYLDSSRAQQQRLLAPLGVMPGGSRGSSRLKITLLDPPRPASRPPVATEGRRRLMLSPRDLWVPLGDCRGDQRECWDVLSLSTRTRRGTIQLHAREKLLGVSERFVYVGRADEDDLIAIWRHAYPDSFSVKDARPIHAPAQTGRR